ncbi:MAG TPA: ABC transporter permease [Acidimicrobiales bacterium]|nr:ABC transporter permease [Acidimicrobiales bacterium]
MATADTLVLPERPITPGGSARADQGGPLLGARRVYGYMLLRYKRTWRGTLTSSFLYPLLYLLAMGIGLGHLVDQHLTAGAAHGAHAAGKALAGLGRLGGVPYAQFIAPGLLVSTAMQMGTNEATYPVMRGVKWDRTYFAMISAPIPVRDVQYGHLAWIATRLAGAAAVFLGVIAAFGDVASPLAVVAIPVAVLTGLAFAAPMMAFAAAQDNDNSFTLIYRMVVMPMFLFSGTFFPLSQLPHWLQVVAVLTPLYHGVELSRGLVLGRVDWLAAAGHVAYLLALVIVGVLAGRRTFRRRLWQ